MNTEELTNYYIAKKQDRSRKLRIEAVECSNEN